MSDTHIGVLLPARLETRFVEEVCENADGGQVPCWKLRIVVIPDEPWMNRHRETVSQDELTCLQALWAACENDPAQLRSADKGQAAFRSLAQQVGPARAWWLVTRYEPGNLPDPGQKGLSRMDALPEQIEIWLGVRQDEAIALQRLEPPLSVDRSKLTFSGADEPALNLFMDGRWWTEDAGLQAEYTLPFRDEAQLHTIELIMAVGLGDSRPGALFESHRNAGLLSLLSLGTPTNTVAGEPAADLAQDPDLWWQLLGTAGEKESREDLALGLAGDKQALAPVPGDTRGHRKLNADLTRLLWPALWDHALRDVWGVDTVMGWRGFSHELGLWAQEWLSPEGPLAPVRIGDQPYGVWPVTRLRDGAWQPAQGDPDVERAWLVHWLPAARREWARGAEAPERSIRDANTDRFVELLGRTPSASAYGYRTFLPLQVMYMLSHSLLGGGEPAGDWLQRVIDQTKLASDALGFPVQPVRRYITTGTRQDILLPLVEAELWTHITGNASGGALFYDAATGEGVSARLDDAGICQLVTPLSGFSPWTHVVPVREDLILFYNKETGVGGISRVDAAGEYHFLGPTSNLGRDWTHVTGTPGGGVLFYRAGTQLGLPGRVGDAGDYQPGILIKTFSTDWTHIVGVGPGTLLFYNAASGSAFVSRVGGDGVYSSLTGIPSPGKDWTHVTGTASGYVLFYNAETGAGATARLGSAGEYAFMGPTPLIGTGWTHVTSPGERGLLFYDAPGGEGATAILDADGKYQSVGPMPRTAPDEKSAFFAQLERLLELDANEGIGNLFKREDDRSCDARLQTNSLLMRLILNAIALLQAEMGRMKETGELESVPLIERFAIDGFCTDLQRWSEVAREMRFDLLLDDGFLCDFFGLGPGCLGQVAEWPVVQLYRALYATLVEWQRAYHAARARVRGGERDALRQLVADIERAFRATLDTATVRIDPWITGMAYRRLCKLRDEQRADGLGLYAWVDKPYTGTPGPTSGGTLMVPSHAQLLTSLILRDKQVHDPETERWQIALDSHKVRLAKQFADEVRAGAHIQEVLGRAVEGIVGNKTQIEQLRKQFRIREEHAGRRVCDGQKVLTTVEGTAFLHGLGLQLAQETALEALRQVTDTYADLLVANAVHAVVSGRPEKAGETLDAAAGLELPPEFDILRTPRAGHSVNTTVWLVLPRVPQPAAVAADTSPAELVDASVATFLAAAVPAEQWTWRIRRRGGNRTVRLTDLGLNVPETLAYGEDALQQLAIRHAEGFSVIDRIPTGKSLSPAVDAHRKLRRLATLLSGHVRDVHNVSEANALLWDVHDGEMRARLAVLRSAGEGLVAALTPELGDPTALRQAWRWGIAPAPVDDDLAPEGFQLSPAEKLAQQLTAARAALQARVDRASALPPDAPAHQVARAIAELSGNAMPIFGHATLDMLRVSTPLARRTTLDREWLETVAAVRPALARVEAHQLGGRPHLKAWSDQEDPWARPPQFGEARLKQPTNLVVCYSPAETLAGELAVAVLDSWSEMIPDKRHIVEAAFGFNAPSSRAPQAILIAVPPDETQPLDTQTLAHIVLEARETAHARLATPADIGDHAALFPLAMVPAQQPTGVSMQPYRLLPGE